MIEIDAVDWDDPDDPEGNGQHIAQHGVTMEEVEEVLYSPIVTEDVSRSTGRPVVFGRTNAGRFLMVVYHSKKQGGFTMVRPITAYEVPKP